MDKHYHDALHAGERPSKLRKQRGSSSRGDDAFESPILGMPVAFEI